MKLKNRFTRFIIPAALAFSACVGSTEAGGQGGGDNLEPPVFLSSRTTSPTEVSFTFSRPVEVVSYRFDPPLEVESIGKGKSVVVTFKTALKVGAKVTADMLVEDEARNTLAVLIPFNARNDRMPKVLINEVRTEYTSSKTKPKSEFVELKILTAGNLGALRLFTAGRLATDTVSGAVLTGDAAGSEALYEFPSVEVAAGEYVVLHLRTNEANAGWMDETGTDLSASGGAEALEGVRDFWVNNTDEPLKKTDGVYLLDQDGKVLDALLLSEDPDPENVPSGIKKKYAAVAEFLARAGAWLPPSGEAAAGWTPSPRDAASSAGTTTTRTISRDETLPDSDRAGDWYVTATSGATPGKPNNPKRYEPSPE